MSRRGSARASLMLGIVAVLLAALSPRASAQNGGWSAQLVLSPLPSPFLSDWEVDPTIGELIVTNPTSASTDVTFHYTVARGSQALVRGTSDPQTIPAAQSVIFNATSTFGGRADWNREVQDLVARTGRLPEGDYEGCVTVAGPGGIVLVARQCTRFNVGYPDPPFLVFPMNGDTITEQDPIFQWQPVQVSPLADARIGYVLQLAEVNTAARQQPEVALESNILHHVEPNLIQTSHQYPVGALPLVSGRSYAWRVVALDGTGRPVASNQGRSEIWTFVYKQAETEVTRTVASVVVTPGRDTLRYVGDTTRFEVRAYDVDNVEIPGRPVAWRSLDSTIARVDSAGVVSARALGATRIVATIDGVVDSALAVTSEQAFAVRFQSYETGDAPSLLEVIMSGSYEEVVPRLMERLRAGEFMIPIPRIAALRRRDAGSGSGGAGGADGTGGDARSMSGPHAEAGEGRPLPADICGGGVSRGASVVTDDAKKVWMLRLQGSAWVEVAESCIGTPPTGGESETTPQSDTLLHQSAIFVVSWLHPGLPRAFLAFKGMGLVPLPMFGTEAHVRYLVVNLTRPVTMDTSTLPEQHKDFFGTEEFDAGFGVTFYSRRRCVDLTTNICRILAWADPQRPEMTTTVFAGITASETSVGGGSVSRAEAGASLALGVSWLAQAQPKKVDIGPLGLTFDFQLGFLISVQDSIVGTDTLGRNPVDRHSQAHNWSVGISPVFTISWTGPNGQPWEVGGQVGLEWNPAEPSIIPTLVASAVVPAVWKFTWLRLGNPQVVGTWKWGEKTTVALSGTWGIGGWDRSAAEAIGLAESSGGAPNDAGHAGLGAAQGFEEAGRGTLVFEFTPLLTPTARRDSAITAVTRLLHQVQSARDRVDSLFRADIRGHNVVSVNTRKRYDDAHAELARLERDLKAKRRERERATKDASEGRTFGCWKTWEHLGMRKCVNWSVRASVGNGSLVDLMAMFVRLLGPEGTS